MAIDRIQMADMDRIASDSATTDHEAGKPHRLAQAMQDLPARVPAVPEDSEMDAEDVQDVNQTSTMPPSQQIQKAESDLLIFRQQSALPSMAASCRFEWHNLNVYVGHGNTKKQVLFNFEGLINSGELLAVMGGSGAGKSTLLNSLSGRTNLNQQRVEGEMAINGNKFKVKSQQIIRALCTFVPQSDILCATQTVEEALLFYAALKLHHLDEITRAKRVNFLIEVLKLNKCRHNLIGDESKRGISGGEKRRVSIAAEILNEADIIFLDEPTSGLDAYTAARTIRTLKQYCSVSNKIIIATIHQPSMEVFYLFDRLILLAAGKCCFNSYLEDIDEYFKKELRPKTNPADVTVFEVQRDPSKWAKKWTNSSMNLKNDPELNHEQRWDEEYQRLTLKDIRQQSERVTVKSNIAMPPAMLQYKLLFKREAMTYIRDKRVTIIRVVQVLVFALISGVMFLNVDERIDARDKSFQMISLIPLLCGMVSLLVAFPQQKLLFTREHSTRTYNTAPWAFALMILEIPREAVHMLLYNAIAYSMIGLDGNWGSYWLTLFLTAYAGGTFGMLIGVAADTLVDAAQLVPVALIPLIVFGDMLVPITAIPVFLRWLALVDPLYYILRSFYLIEFKDVVYVKKLDKDTRQICTQYSSYKNGTLTAEELFFTAFGGNETESTTGNCSAVVDDLIETYNITNYNGYSLDDYSMDQIVFSQLFDQTDTVQSIVDDIVDGVLTSTTTEAPLQGTETTAYNGTLEYEREASERLDEMCGTHEYGNEWLEEKGIAMDDGGLQAYWLFIAIICVVCRTITMALLVIKNNDGFGWLANQIKKIATCKQTEEKGGSSKIKYSDTANADGDMDENDD